MAKSTKKSTTGDKGEGGTFRLKAGQHVQSDPDAPDPELNPVTGEPIGKKANRTYRAGELVESDYDLAAVHGTGKFERVGGPRRVGGSGAQDPPLLNQTSAPGGQVGTGYQGTGGPVSTAKAIELAEKSWASGAKDSHERDDEQKSPGADNAAGDEETADTKDLDEMTVAELREHAEGEEIDLKGAHVKADMVKAIKAARRKK